MLVIYHANCPDGFCCAWLLYKYGLVIREDLVPALYGDEPPWDKITSETEVIVCDFSYSREMLERLHIACKSLVVLDHHKTAEENLRGLDYCTFDMEKSGARLTWDWLLSKGLAWEDGRRPWLVDYTEDRDLWRHGMTSSREVNAALSSYPQDLKVWESLSQRGWAKLAQEGATIVRYQDKLVADHVRRAHKVMIGNVEVLAVNATLLQSEIAGELAKGWAFGACFSIQVDETSSEHKRQWALRSDENGMDVSEIARRYGGGGHKHAAGFRE